MRQEDDRNRDKESVAGLDTNGLKTRVDDDDDIEFAEGRRAILAEMEPFASKIGSGNNGRGAESRDVVACSRGVSKSSASPRSGSSGTESSLKTDSDVSE